MKLGVWILMGLFISCQKVNIPQKNVVKKLTRYGKRNPENLLLISTNFGNFKVRLFEETPLHRADFIRLVKLKVFDNRKIYRVVKGFCIQGGFGSGPDSLHYELPSEISPNIKHKVGSLSMASWFSTITPPDNFFIVSKLSEKYCKLIDKPKGFLNNEYTIFGEVIKGQEVVDKIAEEEVKDKDCPVREILFNISIIKK